MIPYEEEQWRERKLQFMLDYILNRAATVTGVMSGEVAANAAAEAFDIAYRHSKGIPGAK